VVQRIRELGVRPGVSLNPATPASTISEIVADVGLVLVMTVNPGFGGQAFIESTLPKIAQVRRMLDQAGSSAELEVDGGIDATTAGRVVARGATVLVAGSAVFAAGTDVQRAVSTIREAGQRGLIREHA
jgi:ribulose-phosphate 3-epimerase